MDNRDGGALQLSPQDSWHCESNSGYAIKVPRVTQYNFDTTYEYIETSDTDEGDITYERKTDDRVILFVQNYDES